MTGSILAVDFGTSNSAAAVLDAGKVVRLPIEAAADTLPTAVFFPADRGVMKIGQAATDALIAADDGRYMRAMKSVLGTALFHEARLVGGKRRTLAQIVTGFLTEIRLRSEAAAGRTFTSVLSGRPVNFYSADPARNAKSEADLRACYQAAGFATVDFMLEPEAAALATHGLGQSGEIGLIVDIGGGTSDYSVFRHDGRSVRILASHGIRLGGTDFDQTLSMAHAMPYLGYGGLLRREMGEGQLPVPKHIYLDLATWAKIPFLYTGETRSAVGEMVKLAVKPRLLRRLQAVLTREIGHELAFAVERAKIAANAKDAEARIDMTKIEDGLFAPISAASSDRALLRYRLALSEAAQETCRLAGIAPSDVQTVILVGGSSLMSIVASEARSGFPQAVIANSEAFTAVVDGLALATA